MADRLRCAAIVLAAGGSARLGRPKQLVRIEGETLLRRTVRLAIEAGPVPVFVALGGNSDLLLPELDGLATTPLINEEWRSGMASSLKAGLSLALEMNPDLEAVMVLVCDQPRLARPLLRDLLAIHSERRPLITASRYNETLCVPAVFSRPFFSELLQLTGDQGARRILRQHEHQAAWTDFPGGELDLDTPEDMLRLNL